MKLTEIKELAEKIRKKTGKSVSISITCWAFEESSTETTYSFYQPNGKIVEFPTAQDLRAHMENILNPKEDEGVEI